jgi:hypothetical protein
VLPSPRQAWLASADYLKHAFDAALSEAAISTPTTQAFAHRFTKPLAYKVAKEVHAIQYRAPRQAMPRLPAICQG